MITPSFLSPEDQPAIIGKIFNAPIVVKDNTGFPVIELLAWVILTWVAGRQRPDLPLGKRIAAGAINSSLLLATEWCHNLAHAAVAAWIGKPVDAIRDFWGTPLLVYFDASTQDVTPRQHQYRALGGPIFNLFIVPLAWSAKHVTRQGSLAHYVASFALGSNLTVVILSLSPFPFLDGGSLLRWSSVEHGKTLQAADQVVKNANRLVGYAAAAGSAYSLKRRRNWLAAGLAACAATALAIGFGLLKE